MPHTTISSNVGLVAVYQYNCRGLRQTVLQVVPLFTICGTLITRWHLHYSQRVPLLCSASPTLSFAMLLNSHRNRPNKYVLIYKLCGPKSGPWCKWEKPAVPIYCIYLTDLKGWVVFKLWSCKCIVVCQPWKPWEIFSTGQLQLSALRE